MGKYKLSNYNHFLYLEEEDKYLVFNSISNGLAKLEKDLFDLLKSGGSGISNLEKYPKKNELLLKLYKGNIIIDNDFDEVEFLRTRFNMGRFGQRTLSITIVVNLDCNMSCAYCYQGNHANKYPYIGLGDDIIKFVKERLKNIGYKNLFITWYGGEPLLNSEFVFSLSKDLLRLCKIEKIKYGAMIVTNGTLLNKKIALCLKRYKVYNTQITIDGPKYIHDRRRPFKNSKKSSYLAIIRNLEKIRGIIHLQIRINVDKTNISNTLQLIEDLEKRGMLINPGEITVYLGYTREWTSKCSNILPDCFSMREFSEEELKFHKLLIARGFNISNLFPSLKGYCMSVSPHGFIIEPGGEIHKCWSDVGNLEAYLGNIKEPVVFNSKMLKWLSYDPLSQFPECRKCKFFPICGGGCPYVQINQKSKLKEDKNYNCTPWKILMKEKIKIFLQSRAKDITITNKGG